MSVPVLFLNHVGRCGGAEESLLELIAALDRSRYVPHLSAPEHGELCARARDLDVYVHPVAMPRVYRTWNPLRLLSGLLALRRAAAECAAIIEKHAIQLVHANSTTAQLVQDLMGKPKRSSIWHCRDMVPLGAIGRHLADRATRIIAVSAATREALATSGVDAARVTVVHNGVDPARCVAADDRADDTCTTFTMIAHAVPWKRHELFLEAAAELGDIDARFWICGDDRYGDHPERMDGLARVAEARGIAERVRFLGHRDDVPDVLAASDVLVHPADEEPFGRVVVEAMMAGRPAIVADRGGPSEIVRHECDGLIAQAGAAGSFAAAMRRLAIEPALRQQLGASAAQRAREHFTAARVADDVQKIYDDVLGGASA